MSAEKLNRSELMYSPARPMNGVAVIEMPVHAYGGHGGTVDTFYPITTATGCVSMCRRAKHIVLRHSRELERIDRRPMINEVPS